MANLNFKCYLKLNCTLLTMAMNMMGTSDWRNGVWPLIYFTGGQNEPIGSMANSCYITIAYDVNQMNDLCSHRFYIYTKVETQSRQGQTLIQNLLAQTDDCKNNHSYMFFHCKLYFCE